MEEVNLHEGMLHAGHEVKTLEKFEAMDEGLQGTHPSSAEQINGIKLKKTGGRREVSLQKWPVENNTCIDFLSIVCCSLQGSDIPWNTETKRLSVLGQEANGWMGAKKTKNGACRSMRM